MFKKLRQKIDNGDSTAAQDGGFGTPGRKNEDSRRSSRSLNISSNLKKTDSLSSLNSEDMQPTDSTSKEDLYSMLLSRNIQVKRLEVKLAEFGQSLKERSRECDKLSNTLEKQQDSALRKFNELSETYGKDKKNSESTILRLEESEKKLTTSHDQMQEENEALKLRLEVLESERNEFDHQKKEFYEKRDNSEELQDLQKQEMAKLKHMLMNSEKEVKKLQEELGENVAGLMQSCEQNDQLESELRGALKSTEAAKSALHDTVTDNEKLTKELEESEFLKKKLLCENADYKDKLSSLALDLHKSRSNLSSVETAHNKLIDKYEYLKHNSEAILDQAQSDLEEKESSITHLKNKLSMMEQRSNTQKLPQDEQMQALVNERLSLEQKLEESHQQLLNIKSTWSDKINHLETQVSHLNTKIAEDCEELSQKNTELKKIKKDMNAKVELLTSQLDEANEESANLLSHNETILQQIAEVEAKLIEQKTVSDLNTNKHKKREQEMEEQWRKVESDLREKIKELSDKLSQNSKEAETLMEEHKIALKTADEKIQQLSVEVADLQETIERKSLEITSREKINSEIAISLEEVRKDRDNLKKSMQVIVDESTYKKEQLVTANSRIESLTADLVQLKHQLSSAEEKIGSMSSELEDAQMQVDEKHQGLLQSRGTADEKDEQLNAFSEKVSELESHLDKRTTELISCKEEIARLKNSQSEENEELKQLRADRSRLEDRVLEKERSLKLHQQRLNDIKKTLQKEMSKKQQSTSPQLGGKSQAKNTDEEVAHSFNGVEPESNPIPSLLSGDMSLDDPSLSDGQRDVVIKYLKHVVLTFLSCGQSEALQLIRAISAILRFTSDEEKLVREMLEYRTSWFASRPKAKNVIKPSVRGKGRHHR